MTPPPRFTPAAPFVPLPGASGPHAQTILAFIVRSTRGPRMKRVRWDTPDGDFLDADLLAAPADAPHVLVLHGLEGSSRAGYVQQILRGCAVRGWGALALNFRSCSGEPNRTLRAYHSGEITDPLYAIDRLREHGVTGTLFGVGFSLGGSVLLNLLAQSGKRAPLAGGAAISVPFDLASCATLLDQGRSANFIYRERFLKTLKAKSLAQSRRFPGTLDPAAIWSARSIRAFDDAVTAPTFGFASADAYYAECSTAPKLRDIRTPTLIVTSLDDPLAPASDLPADAGDNPWLSLVVTRAGGHCGFMTGPLWRPRFWAEEQAMAFFDHVLCG